MFGATRRLSLVISTLCVCVLLFCFAMSVGAKPRKKSKKQKETAAQKTARLNRETAVRRAILLGISVSQANAVNGDFSRNSGRDLSMRTNPTQANGSSSGAQFVGDPEVAAPGLAPQVATAGQLIISEYRYSLGSYPAGNGATATPDATYTLEITDGDDPDGMGGNPPLLRLSCAGADPLPHLEREKL